MPTRSGRRVAEKRKKNVNAVCNDRKLAVQALEERETVSSTDLVNDTNHLSLLPSNKENLLMKVPNSILCQMALLLDEETFIACTLTCPYLHSVLLNEHIMEEYCRRVFPAQSQRITSKDQLRLRRHKTWLQMFRYRPRVRYNGIYWLETSYYKKPEWNMWTPEITPGTTLRVVYYRYFYFQRDGSVYYLMTAKHPQEAIKYLIRRGKEIRTGEFHVERDMLITDITDTNSLVKFRLQICAGDYGRHTQLRLRSHALYPNMKQMSWFETFETAGKVFHYLRSKFL